MKQAVDMKMGKEAKKRKVQSGGKEAEELQAPVEMGL